MKCISIEKREKFVWRSLFEINLYRKSNEFLQDKRNHKCDIELVSTTGPTQDDYKRQVEQLVKIGYSGRRTYGKINIREKC